MNRCVIFGGGDITDYNYVLTKINCTDYIICADSGYKHTVRLGIKPNLAVGDFDSMEQNLVNNCEVMACSPYKDDTDTMIAVKTALQKGYTEIVLFGMLGGRFDHSIANLQTLRYIAEHGGKAWILDLTAEITVIINGTAKFNGDE
ncbi:MAG: thiamine diphosphokinase, partial [Oscillospiraceae bacterium]